MRISSTVVIALATPTIGLYDSTKDNYCSILIVSQLIVGEKKEIKEHVLVQWKLISGPINSWATILESDFWDWGELLQVLCTVELLSCGQTVMIA